MHEANKFLSRIGALLLSASAIYATEPSVDVSPATATNHGVRIVDATGTRPMSAEIGAPATTEVIPSRPVNPPQPPIATVTISDLVQPTAQTLMAENSAPVPTRVVSIDPLPAGPAIADGVIVGTVTTTAPIPSAAAPHSEQVVFAKKTETVEIGKIPIRRPQTAPSAIGVGVQPIAAAGVMSAQWETLTTGPVAQQGAISGTASFGVNPTQVSSSPSAPVFDGPITAKEPGAIDFSGSIKLGRYIATEREELYRRRIISQTFKDEKSTEIIRKLADLSGIEYIMGDLEPKKMSLKIERPPFRALEDIVSSMGLGLVKKDELWLITQVDHKTVLPRTYKLQNIHLDREFSFRETNGGSSSSSPLLSSGGLGGSSSNSGMIGAGSYEKVTNKLTQLPPRSVAERSKTSTVMQKIERILSSGIRDALIDTENGSGVTPVPGVVVAENSKAAAEQERTSKMTTADYDADSNSIFVMATEQQHMWVKEYLDSIDVINHNIQIGIQFIATGGSKGKQAGVDWTGTAGNGLGAGLGLSLAGSGNTSTPSGSGSISTDGSASGSVNLPSDPIIFGPLNSLRGPQSAILSSAALQARLHLMNSRSDTKTNRSPLVVTSNNREVVFGFTQNRPVVVKTNTANSSGGSNQTTSGTNVSNEQVGTTVRVLPRQVRDGILLLSIDIEITNIIGSIIAEGNEYPIIAKTSYGSDVKVRSGFSVEIGGLEEMVGQETVKKLPLLGDIPLFGFAFKDVVKNNELNKFNLIITARMIDDMGHDVYGQTMAAQQN